MNSLISVFSIFLISILGSYIITYKLSNSILGKRKTYAPMKYYRYVVLLWGIAGGISAHILTKTFPEKIPEHWIPLFGVNTSLIIVALSVLLISRGFNARSHFEKWIKFILFILSTIPVFFTITITLVILIKSIEFFHHIDLIDFLFGLNWQPQNYNEDYTNVFGIMPLIYNTFYIVILTLFMAIPLALFTAIFMCFYTKENVSYIIRPVIEVMATIPSVVHGAIAILFVGPLIRDIGIYLGIHSSYESALASCILITIMILPTMISLFMEVLSSIPKSLIDASLALGATKTETIRKIVIPSGIAGFIAIIIISISRIIGETMIVTMAAGVNPNFTANPFSSMTSFTVQIVNLITSDESFDSPKTLSAFAISMILLVFSLFLNSLFNILMNKFNKNYASNF